MIAWEKALAASPITKAALGPPGRREGPRPIEQEWADFTTADQDAVVYLAGAWNRSGTHMAWGMASAYLGGENYDGDCLHPAIRASATSVERLLSPLAHEARVRIMQAMYDGPKSPDDLSEATGLRSGSLFEHLKELLDATYVSKQGGAYDLTPLGCQMLVMVAVCADVVVREREEG
jgi:DNA-binding HxlR family transcriptional regulator